MINKTFEQIVKDSILEAIEQELKKVEDNAVIELRKKMAQIACSTAVEIISRVAFNCTTSEMTITIKNHSKGADDAERR